MVGEVRESRVFDGNYRVTVGTPTPSRPLIPIWLCRRCDIARPRLDPLDDIREP